MELEHIGLTIDITTKCNLKCKHCRTDSISHEFTLDEIKQIAEKCKKYSPRVIFISGGEPLVRKDIVEVVKILKQISPLICINTNATLINEELLNQLIDAGLNYIQVSLDGIEEMHDAVRGKGMYKKTMENLKLINKYEDKVKLHISSLVSMLNIDYMDQFVNQILNKEKIKVDILGFKRFIPKNEMAGKYDLGQKGLRKMYDNLEQLQKKYKGKTQIVADFPIKNVYNYEKTLEIMKKYNLECAGCDAGVGNFCIRPDGSVSPCSLLYVSAGNIFKQSLNEIINSEVFKNLLERKVTGKCGTCKYKVVCGGCRAAAYQLNGDYLSEDTECYIC